MEQTGCKRTEIHLPLEDSLVLGLKVCITVSCDSISLIDIHKAVLHGSPLDFVYFKKLVHLLWKLTFFAFFMASPRIRNDDLSPCGDCGCIEHCPHSCDSLKNKALSGS